jgi:hypothetical protein
MVSALSCALGSLASMAFISLGQLWANARSGELAAATARTNFFMV